MQGLLNREKSRSGKALRENQQWGVVTSLFWKVMERKCSRRSLAEMEPEQGLPGDTAGMEASLLLIFVEPRQPNAGKCLTISCLATKK